MSTSKKAPSLEAVAIKWAKARGHLVEKTTYRVARARKRNWRDLFGFCDVLLCEFDKTGVTFVQVTDFSNASSRRRKITKTLAGTAVRLLRSGNRIEIWSLREVVAARGDYYTDTVFKQGGRLWQLRRRPVGRQDISLTSERSSS